MKILRLLKLTAYIATCLGMTGLSGTQASVKSGVTAYQQGDYETALRELEAAAQKGDAQALYNLGIFYSAGRGVARDMGKAVAYYEQGARKGSVLAAFNLAQAYRKGDGIAVDYSQAARWYEYAAKRGDFRAGNELGILYIEGLGVRQDAVEGFAWIYPSGHATIMDEKALMNLRQLASTFTKEQLDTAQARGRQYFQRYISPNQNVVRTLLDE